MTIARWIDRIDAERAELLALAESLDPGRLRTRPASGGWSVLEVIEHLVIAEREVIGGLAPAATLRAEPRGLGHRIRYWVVIFVLWSPIRVAVPSPTMVPAGEKDVAELKRMWDENLAWIRTFAAGVGARNEAVFRHPVSGPMALGHALRMDLTHVRSHRRQIRRILS
ncbi:MAG: DinB family protein [Gemmatimonadales bacterium]